MAMSKAEREAHIKAVVAAMLAEEAAEEESLRTIDDIENRMIEIGDMVAREYGAAALRHRCNPTAPPPPCPQCGHASEFAGEHQRSLETRRGPVPVCEAKYRCPKCRRHFFPSDGGVGP